MSHFYGTLQGQAGEATRRGSKNSGVATIAASFKGAIKVDLWYDEADGKDHFLIFQQPWHGAGVSELIADGVIGESLPKTPNKGNAQLEGHKLLRKIAKEMRKEHDSGDGHFSTEEVEFIESMVKGVQS